RRSAPRTGRCRTSDLPGAEPADLELPQRIRGCPLARAVVARQHQEAAQQRSFPIAKARVISEASVPTTPSARKRGMVLALALVLGLMAGTGIAALQEFRERFFRSADDVRNELGLKFLGYLPIIGNSALERL